MSTRTILTILMFTLLMTGMVIGIFYKTSRPKICLFNQARFLTLTSLGVLSDVGDKEQFSPSLTKEELATIKNLMAKLKYTLTSECGGRTPILIERADKSLEIFPGTEIRDITNQVTKKIIGNDRWQQIGKTFLQ